MKGVCMGKKEKGATPVAPLQNVTLTDGANIGVSSESSKQISQKIYAINSAAVAADLQRMVAEAAAKKEAEAAAKIAEADEAKIKRIQEIKEKYMGDVSVEYPETDALFMIGDTPAVRRGEITAIKARAKQGKTMLGSIFMSIAFGAQWDGIRLQADAPRVLYIDTEQSDRSSTIVARRVLRLARTDDHRNNDRFRYLFLRRMPKAERWDAVKLMVEDFHPDLLFLDGIVDCCKDYNNNVWSADLIEDVARVATEFSVAILFCLHRNKNKEDDSMRGHLGTEAVNKAFEVVQVEKKGEVFSVCCTDCREAPWTDFQFQIGALGLPSPIRGVEAENIRLQEKKRTKWELFSAIMSPGEKVAKKDLVQRILDKHKASKKQKPIVERTAYNWIGEAVKNGLMQENNGFYSLFEN